MNLVDGSIALHTLRCQDRSAVAISVQYGQRISGVNEDGGALQAAVFNEREVRASAGLLMMFGFVAFFHALLDKDYLLLKIAAAYFLFEFLVRITVGIHRTPSGYIGHLMTRRYPAEWVSAKPKRFAWAMGAAISFAMVIITNAGITGYLPRTLCLICITLMWLESVLGFCVGCEIYRQLVKRGLAKDDPAYEVCAGGICEIPGAPRAATAGPTLALEPPVLAAGTSTFATEAPERTD
jgi:Domain of unknown function (DUF4395)